MNLTEAVDLINQIYAFEPYDELTKTQMSDLFRELLPGNYKIDWDIDENDMPQVKLKFDDEAESTLWLLKYT